MSEILTECPNCDATGASVYLAAGHPTSCVWMMRQARRCGYHDELLRPDEPSCPNPSGPDDGFDPHHRLSS